MFVRRQRDSVARKPNAVRVIAATTVIRLCTVGCVAKVE
jgi:hypothetical protein